MTKRVLKYPLEVKDSQTVFMSISAKILCVMAQRDIPCLWVETDAASAPAQGRHIVVVGTGHAIPEPHYGMELRYIGSFMLHNGSFVGHVWEEGYEV